MTTAQNVRRAHEQLLADLRNELEHYQPGGTERALRAALALDAALVDFDEDLQAEAASLFDRFGPMVARDVATNCLDTTPDDVLREALAGAAEHGWIEGGA